MKPGTGDTNVNKTDKVVVLMMLIILGGDRLSTVFHLCLVGIEGMD